MVSACIVQSGGARFPAGLNPYYTGRWFLLSIMQAKKTVSEMS